MKTLNKFIIILTLAFLQFSCSEGEVFTGVPDPAKLQFESLPATISTSESSVVSSQPFPITLSIAPKTFDVDVSIEVTAFLPNINKRARKTFIIKAGDMSVDGSMTSPSADQGSVILPFNQELKLYMSAINSKPPITVEGIAPFGFAGKQYTISSNVISMDYGDSGFGGANSNRLAIRFDFANPPFNGNPFFNNLNLRVKRDGVVITIAGNGQTTMPIYGTTISSSRYEAINFLSNALDGTYTLEVFAAQLTSATDPVDVPYRFTVRFPDESLRTFGGTLTGLTVGTAATAVPKLQIVKTTFNGQAQYAVSAL